MRRRWKTEDGGIFWRGDDFGSGHRRDGMAAEEAKVGRGRNGWGKGRRGRVVFWRGTMDLAGGLVGDASRRERFGEVNDIDITHLPIDWVGDPKNLNIKKINESESSCWSLDFMGLERECEGDWVRKNIAFGDIESY